jgi:hypothetical protein
MSWNVPVQCPLKKIIEAMGGELRKNFSCKYCLVNCPLTNQPRKLSLEWEPNNWVLDFSEEFSDYITEVKTRKNIQSFNPLAKISTKKVMSDVKIKGIYPKVKDAVKQYFNFDWDKRIYDLIACIIIASYMNSYTPSLSEIR